LLQEVLPWAALKSSIGAIADIITSGADRRTHGGLRIAAYYAKAS